MRNLWVIRLLLMLSIWSGGLLADMTKPLKPIDTSSPRSTLQGFMDFMNLSYEDGIGTMDNYLQSTRLFLLPEEIARIRQYTHHMMIAHRALDFSELPPAMRFEKARVTLIQLKDILDRLQLPPMDSVPDKQAMASIEPKRWILPDTDIRIVQISSGPRIGEYLFSSDTVRRIPEFYDEARQLPDRSGAAQDWFTVQEYRPIGVAALFHRIIPPRWLLGPDQSLSITFLGQPVWRWLGMGLVLLLSIVTVRGLTGLSQRLAKPGGLAHLWADLIRPFSLALVSALSALVLEHILRITGNINAVLIPLVWSLSYLALTWLAWSLAVAISETIIVSERLRTSSIDSQLIRMVIRLIALVSTGFILMKGADEIGLPAYSVVAGLGIGGLAVALAAQQTLSNLVGSLIIMFEKPFTIGDRVKVMDLEGEVISVGFRSVRLQTIGGSVVTVPSSKIVDSPIHNLLQNKDGEFVPD